MRNIIRLPAMVLFAGIAFATLCPIGLRPETGHPTLERATAYFLLGAALAIGFPRHIVRCAILTVIVSGALETLQLIDPGRDGRLNDFFVKMIGGILGTLAIRLILAARHRLPD